LLLFAYIYCTRFDFSNPPDQKIADTLFWKNADFTPATFSGLAEEIGRRQMIRPAADTVARLSNCRRSLVDPESQSGAKALNQALWHWLHYEPQASHEQIAIPARGMEILVSGTG